MDLVEDREELLLGIEFELERLSGHPPLEIASEVCDYLSLLLRTDAKCCILLDGDRDRFFHTLRHSAQVRSYYLQRVAKADSQGDPFFAVSNGPAFFDALAARDFHLAAEIAALSPGHWQSESEYEDDFCFYKFFHLLASGTSNDDTLKQLVVRFEEVIQGEDSARLAVCQALLDRDQDAFDSAIEALLDERSAQIDADNDRFFTDEIVFYAKRCIYVEGLAVLNVADHLGLATREEYRYCPHLCRLPMQTPFSSARIITSS